MQIDVNMDVKTTEEGTIALTILGDAAKNTGVLLSGVFDDVSIQVGSMVTEIEDMVTAITSATAAVEDLTEALEEQGGSDLFFNVVSTAISSLSLACDLFEREKVREVLGGFFKSAISIVGGLPTVIGDGFNFALASVMDAPVLSEGKFVTGIKDYVAAVKSAQPEVGTFAAMFPKLSTVLSDAGGKLKDLGSAIGTALASFGSMTAEIVRGTAQWIKNTAVTVGNTVAQWAQIAATTAWKAICVVATAVTTAFGAAMTFLTSHIGLVVIGITALIAIIVLLIANWDTVKEWLITGWEAIKSALGTAAEWFNNTIIQPVVGFFTNAMDWISTKVQEGFAFVQAK